MKSLLLLIVVVIVGSCTAFELGNANSFSRGMTKEQVLDIANQGPRKTAEFTVNAAPGDQFTVMLFDLALGTTAADYFSVFRNGKLMYWGHPFEFNRHADPLINAIGEAAVLATK